jgi:hypothetical protein
MVLRQRIAISETRRHHRCKYSTDRQHVPPESRQHRWPEIFQTSRLLPNESWDHRMAHLTLRPESVMVKMRAICKFGKEIIPEAGLHVLWPLLLTLFSVRLAFELQGLAARSTSLCGSFYLVARFKSSWYMPLNS